MNPLDPSVEREIGRIDAQLAKLPEIDKAVAVMARDIEDIKSDVAALKAESRRAAEDRRAEFKWRIGTALVTVGLIISAMAVLLSVLGGGGT